MKKFLFISLAALVLTTGCNHKSQAELAAKTLAEKADSIVEAVVQDTVPPPAFLFYSDSTMAEILYWQPTIEPDTMDGDLADYWRTWALQDKIRRNAARYTTLIVDDARVKIQLKKEVLKDPDGNDASIGVLHYRKDIPAAGLVYTLSEYRGVPTWSEGLSHFVVVTDSYLATRRQLSVKRLSFEEPEQKLPVSVVGQLEQQYGKRVTRTRTAATIGDGRFTYGVAQFEIKDKQVLAAEVVVAGEKVFTLPVEGYWDDDCQCGGWNVDDEGEFFPSRILAAFESEHGLELYFERNAPESSETGIMRLSDGELKRQEYGGFYRAVDDRAPLWKADIAEMQRLYKEDRTTDGKGELTRYKLIDIDFDNVDEIWAHEEGDADGGALFTRKDGKITLIGVETSKLVADIRTMDGDKGYIIVSGSQGGPTYDTYVYALKNSEVVDRFYMSEVYDDIETATLNGKKLSSDDARAYVDGVPGSRTIWESWINFDEQ